MQRNIEHEHGPKNTERCRVVSKLFPCLASKQASFFPAELQSNNSNS